MDTVKPQPQTQAGPPANVYQAIAKVQAALAKEGIVKNRKNKEQGYNFRGIDEVYNTLSGILVESGLCILPRCLKREQFTRTTKSLSVLNVAVVEAEFDFVSAADGSKHTVRTFGEAQDSADKATNKAMSAAYKYACLQTFCIPTEGDNDADATTHEPTVAGVFPSLDELNAFVANCVDALGKAATLGQVKDQRDLNAARVFAMKASPVAEDRDGYAKIIAAQNAVVGRLKAAPPTVDEAKMSASLPASVAGDEIQF